jgi:hypothetical protein
MKFTLKFKGASNETTQYNRNLICTFCVSELEIAKTCKDEQSNTNQWLFPFFDFAKIRIVQ